MYIVAGLLLLAVGTWLLIRASRLGRRQGRHRTSGYRSR